MAKIAELCTEKLRPIVEALGYELVEVEYAKKVDGMNLTLFIDCEKGILVDDCEKVHRAVDTALDTLNPTDDSPYILNVSSLGLDRPIKTDADLKRNLEKEIEVTLYKKQDGEKKFTQKLIAFDEKKITLEKVQIARADIAHIAPVIKF